MADDDNGERILHLEHVHSELAAKVAETSVGIQYLSKEISESYDRLAGKMDTCIAPLAAQVQETHQHLLALGDVVGGHAKVIEKIQDEKKRVAERWGGVKKVAFAVLTGGGAICVKELAVLLFKHN